MALAAPPLTLPVAEFSPDMPPLQNGASVFVNNVIPRTPLSYGPMPSFAGYGGALTARCQGMFLAQDDSGNITIFAGDKNDLYTYTSGATAPTKVSKSAGTYSTAADSQWRFAQFGLRVIATNGVDPIQSFLLGTDSAFSDLSSGAPKGFHMAIIKSFLVVANTSDTTNGTQPQAVWNSTNNDPTSWPTPGTATAAADQSTFVNVVGEGGQNQALVGNLGNADGALLQEHAVWRAVYTGTSVPLAFYPAEGVKGTPAPNSVVHFADQVYYLGEDGFYRFDGGTSYPIGANKVDKTFWANVSAANLFNVIGTVDPINRCIIWIYPSNESGAGLPDSMLVYNWQIDRWSQGVFDLEWIGRAASFGYTLTTLDNTGFTLTTLPYSLDSRVWTGGNPLLSGFDQSHKLGFFNGAPLAGTVDTIEKQLIPGRRATVLRARPLVNGSTSTIAMGTRNRLEDVVSFAAAQAMNDDGFCPQRAEGRYHRARIATADADTMWGHIEGVELEFAPGGGR